MRSLRFRAEDAVAFLVLAPTYRGGGDVDEEVELVAIELSERCQAVVIAPRRPRRADRRCDTALRGCRASAGRVETLRRRQSPRASF